MHEECDKGHSRVEIRRIQVADIAATSIDFPGAKQVFRIERETLRGRDPTPKLEVAYGITSLGVEVGSPERLLSLVRGHWGIENRSHHVRDVTMNEDASRIRSGNGPHAFAALRNAAIGLIRLAGGQNVAESIRSCGWRPDRALRAIGIAIA